ncbi:MAG: Aminopeptidase YpdF [Firmicutes bacterium]|nr:Aminopeptidase YpdF [candidate division NPL-UPA2 bacterium]
MEKRLAKLRASLPEGFDAYLVAKPDNRAYLTGFTGSNGYALISRNTALLLTDFRYVEQAAIEAPEFMIKDYQTSLYDALQQALTEHNIQRLGFESDYITFSIYETLKEKLQAELVPQTGLVEKLRMVKDEAELASMRRAAAIAEAALRQTLPKIKVGVSEAFIALELEIELRRLGSERLAFEIIAASGPRSSLPHGRASDKLIRHGDFLTLDFGAVYNGYCSDMTRTFVVGKATDEQRRIYGIVLKAQQAALAAAKPGRLGKEVDAVAREIIAQAGYAERFGHGLGHGVGRAVHEGPSAGTKGEDALQPNMVITIEPGIYIPEWGGVRIEDMVVVTPDGCENFYSFSKELIEL